MIRKVAMFVVLATIMGLALLSMENGPSVVKAATDRPDLTKLMPPSAKVYTYVKQYAEEYRVPEHFVFRCARQETSYGGYLHEAYNPYTAKMVSIANAYGPFQVRVIAAREVWPNLRKVSDRELAYRLRYDIDFNVHTAIRYMRHIYDQTHSWPATYSAYNQGEVGKTNINGYAIKITRNT